MLVAYGIGAVAIIVAFWAVGRYLNHKDRVVSEAALEARRAAIRKRVTENRDVSGSAATGRTPPRRPPR